METADTCLQICLHTHTHTPPAILRVQLQGKRLQTLQQHEIKKKKRKSQNSEINSSCAFVNLWSVKTLEKRQVPSGRLQFCSRRAGLRSAAALVILIPVGWVMVATGLSHA